MVAWEIFTVAFPVFVTVKLCDALLPTGTLPKLKLVELRESTPELSVLPPELTIAAQLDSPTIAKMRTTALRISNGAQRNGLFRWTEEIGARNPRRLWIAALKVSIL
jgi:hypothetical protein